MISAQSPQMKYCDRQQVTAYATLIFTVLGFLKTRVPDTALGDSHTAYSRVSNNQIIMPSQKSCGTVPCPRYHVLGGTVPCRCLVPLGCKLPFASHSLRSLIPKPNPKSKVGRLYKPGVPSWPRIRVAGFILGKVKVPDESRNQLAHFKHGDVAADAGSGAKSELTEVSTKNIQRLECIGQLTGIQ